MFPPQVTYDLFPQWRKMHMLTQVLLLLNHLGTHENNEHFNELPGSPVKPLLGA